MEKIILKGIIQKFDPMNRNPPSYRARGFWSKNLTRKDKIKNIFNEQTRTI